MSLKAEDIARFTALYTNPNITIDDVCGIFGYAPGSVYRMAFELGLKRPKGAQGAQLNMKQIRAYCERVSMELPPIKPYKVPHTVWDVPGSIDFILHLGDEHAGRQSKSTNAVVFGNRMDALATRIANRVDKFRKWAPIGKLHIFKLGDTVTGERVGLNVQLEELEHTILTQCYGLAIPRLTMFTERMLQVFSTIDVYAVCGNHGVVARPMISKGANWDAVVYLGWQAKMASHPEVTFDIATVDWYNTATVKNTDWLIVHGDQIRGGQPYGAVSAVLPQWHQVIPVHFDYVSMGHFHHVNKIREAFMNGTLLTDDAWSMEVVKRDGECCQVLMAVSDKGIEDIMPIWLDDVGEEEE